MEALSVLGLGLFLAAVALAWQRDFVIRHLTSRPLGSLAPGFAATRRGFNVYAALVAAIGIVLQGLAVMESVPVPGLILVMAGAAVFVIGSAIAIAGEVIVYRRLKR